MIQITALLPDELVASLDEAANRLHVTRTVIVRQAVEFYLDDLEDMARALEVLQDPADPVLDWSQAKRDALQIN
jgi:predicted DNA-binding protein